MGKKLQKVTAEQDFNIIVQNDLKWNDQSLMAVKKQTMCNV